MDKNQIIEAIKAMTVLELNELVKACEEEFGVSAAAPVAVVGAAGAAYAVCVYLSLSPYHRQHGDHGRQETQSPQLYRNDRRYSRFDDLCRRL